MAATNKELWNHEPIRVYTQPYGGSYEFKFVPNPYLLELIFGEAAVRWLTGESDPLEVWEGEGGYCD